MDVESMPKALYTLTSLYAETYKEVKVFFYELCIYRIQYLKEYKQP